MNPEFKDKRLHEQEWVTCQRAKQEWAKKRVGKSVAHVDERLYRDVGDKLMQDYLREEGALPSPQ